MKTITFNRMLNANFKQTQLLPALSPEMLLARASARVWREVWPAEERPAPPRPRAGRSTDRRLPLLRPDHSPAERILMGVLGLSALICLGQAAATMLEWSGHWYALEAWVSRLIG